MDDNEARYLIDQFNKYASWNVRRLEPLLAYVAVSAALGVFFFSRNPFSDSLLNSLVIYAAVMVYLAGASSVVVIVTNRHSGYRARLIVLEDYRSKHKSLPDTLTFSKIIKFKEFKTDDLDKLLKESWPAKPP